MRTGETSNAPAPRRTQLERRQRSTHLLLDAARELFTDAGYADTATPQIAAKAGLTRGALYHHFDDKRALLLAVVVREAEAVARHVDAATRALHPGDDGLGAGSRAFFEAMRVPGRAKLLLVDAPAVLGPREVDDLLAHSKGDVELATGLSKAMPDSSSAHVAALAEVLSAAFDRAALAIARGGDPDAYENAMLGLVRDATRRADSDGSDT